MESKDKAIAMNNILIDAINGIFKNSILPILVFIQVFILNVLNGRAGRT